MPKPGLFGIKNSNRSGAQLFGKNDVNSTLPVALACWMSAEGIAPVYLYAKGGEVRQGVIPALEALGLNDRDAAYFQFEGSFKPHNDICTRPAPRVDLVVRPAKPGRARSGLAPADAWLRALEVKQTVVPDMLSSTKPKSEWAPEIVFRPATTICAALGIALILKERGKVKALREIFERPFLGVRDWTNAAEMKPHVGTAVRALSVLLETFQGMQRPLVLQQVWRTVGQSPELEDDAFDIFVWSNFAFVQVVIDLASEATGRARPGVNRYERAALRLARFFFEFARTRTVDPKAIWDGMDYGSQSDKEFSLPSSLSIRYLRCRRLRRMSVPRSAIHEIVLNEGGALMKPERRLDQSIKLELQRHAEERAATEVRTPKASGGRRAGREATWSPMTRGPSASDLRRVHSAEFPVLAS